MALDIAKQGRKPYQALEKPESRASSVAHIRRYFGRLTKKLASALLAFSAFALIVWVWDFGTTAGFGRSAVWALLSGFTLVLLAGYALFRAELPETIPMPRQYRELALLALLVLAVFGVGSVVHRGAFGALGLGELSGELTFAGAAGGAAWLFAVLFVRSSTAAVKQFLLAAFFGSTILASYVLIRLLFAGGYGSVAWVPPSGALLLFGVVTFLMLAFAMFQKREVKLLWTTSIALHLAVLFAWDRPAEWLVLIAGISALLIFQIVTATKLWQRNFTYPLQVWAVALLLLLSPVKLFTGTSVPEPGVLSFEASRAAVSRAGLTVFGSGLGGAARSAALTRPSFYEPSAGAFNPEKVGHGYLQLYLESGMLGLLGWLALAALVIVRGVRFLRTNLEALKERRMSESVYRGAIFLVGTAMLAVGTYFSPFSLLVYWLSLFLFGGSVVFWHADALGSEPEPGTHLRRPGYAARAAAAVLLVAYVWFLFAGTRVLRAHRAAIELRDVADARLALEGWREVTSLHPFNPFYRLEEARWSLALLSAPISIDAQRESIEAVTKTLARETADTRDPLIHWIAAEIYAGLQTYAEGSSPLARGEYQKARALWPSNVALPVAITQFYREHTDSLVSGSVSAAELRIESRQGLEQALVLEPDYLPARLELAFLRESEEGIASALAELEPWEDASAEIQYHIGRLYFNDGDFARAAEKFADVIRDVPNHSNARYSLGVAYFRLEQYDDAFTEFQEVLRLNPGNEDVQEKINQVQDLLGE